MKKRIGRLFGVLALTLVLLPVLSLRSEAKTLESTSVENIFFYAANSDGELVLLRVMPLSELSVLQHGQLSGITTGEDTGVNYYVSYTDNFPTTGYGEGKGFTVMELVDYISRTSPVEGAGNIRFDGEDVIRFMATDGGGSYARSYSYTQMYGVTRYYFEDLFNSETGWNVEWEVPTSSLDTYYSDYADSDPYFESKRAVFEGGTETCAVLAFDSYAGRTSGTLTDSYTGDIAGFVAANKGVTGCLASVLDTKMALRVFFPQTEAQLMCGVRTASENFKWIYNLCLDMAEAPTLNSLGMVAVPEASYRLSEDGNTLYITLSCETEGASLYYSYDGAPQLSYTGPISYDVTGMDLESNPVNIFMTAVKEGYTDAGVVSSCYYQNAPEFPTYANIPLGDDVVFYPSEDTADEEWSTWASALRYVEVRMPGENEYEAFPVSRFKVDNDALTITFDAADFDTPGDYRMVFHADGYASSTTTRCIRYASPELLCADVYSTGDTITVGFPGAGGYMASAAVSVMRLSGDRYITVPADYLTFSDNGLRISGAYFAAEKSAFTGPGLYVIRLRSSQTTEEFMYAYFAVDYTDLRADAWYSAAVDYMIDSGLMLGVSGSSFAPDQFVTRAMLLTALYRVAGSPPVENINEPLYTEAENGAWYSEAVSWAYGQGLLDTEQGKSLDPDELLTREQVLTVIYRWFGSPETDISILSEREDAGSIQDAAPMAWAVENGVINGTSAASLSPQDNATRAQLAQILFNLMALVKSSGLTS